MMRIAIVSPSTLPFSCGNSILAERLRKGLSSRGHTVSVFDSIRDDCRRAVQFAPDILHSLHALKPAGWLDGFFAQYRAPWVTTLTGTDYNTLSEHTGQKHKLAERLASARAVIVFHDDARRFVAGEFPDTAGMLHVIPQSIDFMQHAENREALRLNLGFSREETVFLMVSGIRPVKNIASALKAFKKAEKIMPGLRFVLVGPVIDQPEAASVLDLGRSASCFSYRGELSHHEVRTFMAASDVFLNTSFHEGMSGAILEAMSERLPVIATAVAGNMALVSDNVNGMLVAPDDLVALASVIIRLATDSHLRISLGEAGFKKAQGFSVQKEIDAYEGVYGHVIKGF